MDRLIKNCITGQTEIVSLTQQEIEQIEVDKLHKEEQELLDSLTPSDKEMLMAEVEIQTITILMEVGLI